MTDRFVPAGCRGLVSVAANIWPSQIQRFVHQCCNQSPIPKAYPKKKLQQVHQACDALSIASNPIPTKVLLHHKGEIVTPHLACAPHPRRSYFSLCALGGRSNNARVVS